MVGDTALVLGSLRAMINFKNMRVQEFPGGPVVKNPPDKAADTGLIPDLGRFHMLRVSKAHAPQLLNPRAANTKACAPRACTLQEEEPPQ